jgi:hypothetical protein
MLCPFSHNSIGGSIYSMQTGHCSSFRRPSVRSRLTVSITTSIQVGLLKTEAHNIWGGRSYTKTQSKMRIGRMEINVHIFKIFGALQCLMFEKNLLSCFCFTDKKKKLSKVTLFFKLYCHTHSWDFTFTGAAISRVFIAPTTNKPNKTKINHAQPKDTWMKLMVTHVRKITRGNYDRRKETRLTVSTLYTWRWPVRPKHVVVTKEYKERTANDIAHKWHRAS